MKILVTGANGYLGQGIVKQLLDRNQEVVAAGFKTDMVDDRATKIECNIFNIESPYEYFGKPDAILHLAWKDGFVHNSDSHIMDLPLHYMFLKKMVESGIKNISVMGSMHEIGFYEGCVDSNTSCKPMSLYGIGKNALRESVELLSDRFSFEYKWLRGYYIVGNSENGSSIFSKIVQAEKRGDKSFPFTTGKNQYDFIDYDDFCKQVVSAICQSKVNGIINICSGFPEKLSDRVERFIADNNFKIKLDYGRYPDRPYDSKAIWGNNKKILSIIDNEKV